MPAFSDLSLSEPVARAISELGFELPSPIQAETLPILLDEPTDFLGLAATGTGKTAAFSIPMIEGLSDDKSGAIEALILCPTRELALQVCEQVALIGKYKRVQPLAIYGGAGYHDQVYGLKRGPKVVVGTPGRVVDHLERGTLKLENLRTLILDEADEMISMGFKEDLDKVLSAAPRESDEPCRIWLFSATMNREVRRVADAYLREPEFVQINRTEMVPPTIEQIYYPARESDKAEIVCKLIEATDDFYGLIFCQTKALVVELAQFMHERGFKVDSLHGDKDQNSRERTMQSFRDRKVEVLVCTDVASRGLDVKDITHVINYSLPRELDNYVHRIGRTGRSGKAGIAMNLVTLSHRRLILQIEKFTKTKMREGQIPTRREIGARKVREKLTKFSDQPYFSRALEVMGEEWKEAVRQMPPEEIAGRFLAMMMPEIFNDVARAPSQPRFEARPGVPPARPSFQNARPPAREFRSASKPAAGAFSRPMSGPGPIERPAGKRTERPKIAAQSKVGAKIGAKLGPKIGSPKAPAQLGPDGAPLNRKARRALKFGTETGVERRA